MNQINLHQSHHRLGGIIKEYKYQKHAKCNFYLMNSLYLNDKQFSVALLVCYTCPLWDEYAN